MPEMMKLIVLLSLMAIEGGAYDYKTKEAKVIYGIKTTIQKYPFLVQLEITYRPTSPSVHIKYGFCGGSVISKWHVLTAAHCFVTKNPDNNYLEPPNPDDVSARIGSAIRGIGSVHQGSAIIVHPNFHRAYNLTFADIAVLALANAISYNSKVQPAVLPHQDEPVPDNVQVQLVGWGRTVSYVPKLSRVLRDTTVSTVSLTRCKTILQQSQQIPKSILDLFDGAMFCAGGLDSGGKNTCHGDSGGPVIYDGVIIGVTSWGTCGQKPGVFTEVSAFINWIKDVITKTTSVDVKEKALKPFLNSDIIATNNELTTTNGSPTTSQSLLTKRVLLIHILVYLFYLYLLIL